MSRPSLVPSSHVTLREQILEECEAIMRHALGNGLAVPGSLAQDLNKQIGSVLHASAEDDPGKTAETDIASLMAMHRRLARIVSPANPKTLLLLARERESGEFLHRLAPLPLIRHVVVPELGFWIGGKRRGCGLWCG